MGNIWIHNLHNSGRSGRKKGNIHGLWHRKFNSVFAPDCPLSTIWRAIAHNSDLRSFVNFPVFFTWISSIERDSITKLYSSKPLIDTTRFVLIPVDHYTANCSFEMHCCPKDDRFSLQQKLSVLLPLSSNKEEDGCSQAVLPNIQYKCVLLTFNTQVHFNILEGV